MPVLYARGILTKRRLGVLGALTASAAALAMVAVPSAQASPPAPVDAATARAYLAELTVAAEGSLDGYSRDKYPHWSGQDGSCDTREAVLKRDGKDVETDSSCKATSGSWFSEYDGETWTAAGDVDIDHLVPLAESWRSGANGWTNDQREGFANDMSQPQLIAVTDNVNQAKGDKDPAKWMPPTTSYHCTYVRMWVQVKHHYKLTVDEAEKSALESQLSNC
ncbi:HNH endonuclease [Streptomyces sp. NA04227]|uniref:HNH endonuclease family protein n=1 Tax=Streptomyces sp. NA04227 TaxID=2742136 RepID=UPI001591CEE5|nr:HNH endonuclease family protein [Streptomyces sp. NA04227]QKW06265.1 HNH endonuclease [Streptomyces sp. NA04227]